MTADDQNLSERAYDRLRADIVSSRIPPGSRLNIAELCDRLSVSQGAVREGLSRLISERLVVSERNRGFRATMISIEALQDLSKARAELDSLCLRQAIARNDIEWEANLLSASHRARRHRLLAGRSDRDADAFVAAHGAFHEAIAAGCENEWLIWARRLLATQSERYRHLCLPLLDVKRELYDEDGSFLAAVLDRDAETAVAILTSHYDSVVAEMLRTIEIGARLDEMPEEPAEDGGRLESPRRRRVVAGARTQARVAAGGRR